MKIDLRADLTTVSVVSVFFDARENRVTRVNPVEQNTDALSDTLQVERREWWEKREPMQDYRDLQD